LKLKSPISSTPNQSARSLQIDEKKIRNTLIEQTLTLYSHPLRWEKLESADTKKGNTSGVENNMKRKLE
jgi:hypothetical protein